MAAILYFLRKRMLKYWMLLVSERDRTLCYVDVDFRSVRRWVQQHPFKADMVNAERVPSSTRVRLVNLTRPMSEHCSQDLADHFACVAQRYRQQHCSASTCADFQLQSEVTEAGVQIFPDENCATVSFHCRPGRYIAYGRFCRCLHYT